jgi:hypothetical protein
VLEASRGLPAYYAKIPENWLESYPSGSLQSTQLTEFQDLNREYQMYKTPSILWKVDTPHNGGLSTLFSKAIRGTGPLTTKIL